MRTSSIIEPPVRNGGSAASSSPRPHSTPTPDGPSILCPENAAKSTPSAVRLTGWGGTHWHASSTVTPPAPPGPRHQLRDRQHAAEHVGLVRERHDLRALRQLERVEVQPPVVRH